MSLYRWLVEAAGDPVNMGEVWMAVIDAIKNAPVPGAAASEGTEQ